MEKSKIIDLCFKKGNRMSITKDDGTLAEESENDLKTFMNDPYFIHYVGMLIPPRPGFDDCVQQLEFSYFKPGTKRNDLFHLRVISWEDIVWGVVSIPISEKRLMETVAAACRLRVANGVPCVISADGFKSFPFENSRMFTLENIPGHPVYSS